MGVAKEVKPRLRLTALHLAGFKSFANKIELRFGPGVTAIVGPNGSGKSNVVDAVRWVLGEQNSRALRSARVTNLIFAGTEQRKPLGMAQATLVLDNSEQTAPIEYDELNIVRRVYRSGESEFLINGTPCRLRDIQQLLLGTGLGRGGMAVVGQGEIDAILSARPHDRRLLLEETAGTSRYRAQQRTAEQRLERARQDLSRVRDLIHEITDRVDTLTEQAAAAARYKELTAALQQHRASRAARDWSRARTRQLETVQQLAEQRGQLARLEQEAADRRTLEAEARTRLEQGAEQLEAARAALQDAEAQAAAAAHRLQLLKLQWESAAQRQAGADEEQARRRADEEKAEQLRRELRSTIETEGAAVARLKESVAETAAQLVAFETRHKGETVQGDRLRDELMQLLQTVAGQRHEMEQLEREQAGARSRRADEEQARQTVQSQLEAARMEYDAAHREAAQGAQRIREGEAEDQRLADELKQARGRLAAISGEAADVRSRLHETEATQRALERLEQTYAGYRPAVKAVLGATPQLRGVLGTVAQLLEVPERFELPVQVALGGATQFLVMEDEQAVLQAIDRLRRDKAGRATFLALDSIRPRPWPRQADKLLQSEGVLGRAADVVRFEPALTDVVQYLLGRVAIVEQLQRAQQLARTLPPAVRLVTLQGDLLTPGGPVTGGFQGTQAVDGTLSRRRELRTLERRTLELQKRLRELTASAEEANALVVSLEQRVTDRRSSTTADAIEQAKQHQRALQAEAEARRLEASLRQAEADEVARAERDEYVAERITELQKAIAEAEVHEGELRRDLQRRGEHISTIESERRALSETASEQRAELAGREEALRGLERRYADTESERIRAMEERQRLEQLRRAAQAEQDRLHDEIKHLEKQVPEAEHAAMRQREAVQARVEEQAQRRAALAELEAAGRAAVSAAEKAKERVWTTEAALARHESAVESYEQRLRELDLAPDEAERLAEEKDAPRADVRSLEEQLEAIGPVHLGAEAELKEFEERLQFLTKQQQDLEEAGFSLEEVIERLEQVSERRFSDTLDKVAGEFDGIFRRLFAGGRGRLVMSDEDDGVDVHVQMPGKRQQNLLALSGGERALTAIALLFAILKVQPSPFYLLDEIDSALDEANLVRFQALLREASQDAQFIVITHRATTMEVADTLYGVTAAEPGVSTVISLDLQAAMATIA